MPLKVILAAFIATSAYGKESIRTSLPVYLIDQTIEIQTSGLRDGKTYTVRAETTDHTGRMWTASASFVASEGKIDFSQKPVSGSYTVASTQGMFWSMRPENYQLNRDFFRPAENFQTELKLFDEAQNLLSEYSFLRRIPKETFDIEQMRSSASYYDLFIPNTKVKKPAVLLLGGSEGGLNQGDAQVIASHGFVVMALAYFGADPLPKELNEIALEYIYRNAEILRSHPDVDPTRVSIWGTSKGGELALLTAATYPDMFNSVVGVVPSHIVWQGLTQDLQKISSWSQSGKPLPFLPYIYEEADFKMPPFKLRVGYERALQLIEDKSFAEIPVEKIKGPILLVSGTDDQVWPSSTMANSIAKRLARNSFEHEVVNLVYKGAGHFIGLPSWPTSGRIFGDMDAGGNQEADGLACSDSWPQIIKFLKKNSNL